MAVHDPEGLTIASAPFASKIPMSRRASARASSRYPVLNAGCPQQVWRSSNSTVHPARRSTATAPTAAAGQSWSARQVTNNDTRIAALLQKRDHALDVIRRPVIARERARHVVERWIAVRDERRDVHLGALDQTQRAPVGGRPAVALEAARGAHRRQQRRLQILERAQHA